MRVVLELDDQEKAALKQISDGKLIRDAAKAHGAILAEKAKQLNALQKKTDSESVADAKAALDAISEQLNSLIDTEARDAAIEGVNEAREQLNEISRTVEKHQASHTASDE